ncbi:MAG: HPr kinase/phosphatase C-terminal domain-containing protein [Rhizomicrobium sp.]
MPKSANIHATCVRLGRDGVLLTGRSGSGKSDLALRLIGLGAVLVADDRVLLSVAHGRLVAAAPAAIAGLLEVRGVGIVPMKHAAQAPIALVVDLEGTVERLPQPRRFAPPSGLPPASRPPLICLNAFEISAAYKIVAALRLQRDRASRRAVKRN